MHDMLERRFSHQAQVQALKMRTEELARRAPPDTATTRQIVTKTVVVKVPPTTTAPANTVKPVVAPTTTPATTSTKPTPTTTSSSSTTTTTTTPATRATSTTSTTPSTTPPKPAATTNRNVASPSTPLTTAKTSPTVLSPSVDASNAKASSGLSSGATGGIIAGVVLAGLVIVLFVVRKMYIHRRERKRNTWGAGLYPSYNDKDSAMGERQGLTANEPVPTPITSSSFGATGPGFGTGTTPRTADWRNDQLPSLPQMAPASTMSPPSFYITPPPASYNNAVTDDAYGGLAVAAPTSPNVDTAIVNKMYHPTLADELAVTVGEVVQVLRAFDDGWALCQNARGDKGVVPLQCLDWAQNANAGAPQIQAPSPGGYGHDSVNGMNGDWRNMKRLSSLSGHGTQY